MLSTRFSACWTLRSLLIGLGFALILSPAFSPAAAQESSPASRAKSVDPSGSWRWTHEEGGETVKDLMKLRFDGKVVTGTYKGRVERPIEMGKMEGDRISVGISVDVDGRKLVARFTGAVRGDEIADGKVDINFDGQDMQFPWPAKRTVEAEDLVGTWNIRIEADGRVLEAELKLSQDGDRLKGKYTSKGIDREFEAQNVQVVNHELRFEVAGEVNDRKFNVKYKGKPRGDKMNGEIDYELGDRKGTIEFQAQRG